MTNRLIIGFIIFLLIVSFSGCNDLTSKSNIEIISYEMNNKNFGFYGDGIEVKGIAKNNANTMKRVSIIGRLYDENGNYLGNNHDWALSDNVDSYSVPAGYTWNFKLVYHFDFSPNAKSIKFEIEVS